MRNRTVLLGLILSTSVFAQSSSQDELVKTITSTPQFTQNLFEKSAEYRLWADSAASALKTLAEDETSLSPQTVSALIDLVKIKRSEVKTSRSEPSTLGKNLRLEILWDGKWVSPIGPIASVLAKHNEKDVVPYLVERYNETPFGQGDDKIEIFFALMPFLDDASAPVFADQLPKLLGRGEAPQWDLIVQFVLPVLYNASASGDKAATAALQNVKARNKTKVVQDAVAGQFPKVDPNNVKIAVIGPNGRTILKDTGIHANTNQVVAEHAANITKLGVDQTALASTVDANKTATDSALAALAVKNTELASKIEGLDTKTRDQLATVNKQIAAEILRVNGLRDTMITKEEWASAQRTLAEQITALSGQVEGLSTEVQATKDMIAKALESPSTQPSEAAKALVPSTSPSVQ